MGNRCLIIDKNNCDTKLEFEAWKFTSVGVELFALVSEENNEDYLHIIAEKVINKGFRAFIGNVLPKDSKGRQQIENTQEVLLKKEV